MSPLSSPLYRLSRLLSSTAVVVWMAIQTCSSQTQQTAFGEIRTFRIPAKFEQALLVPGSDRMIVAWAPHHGELLLVRCDSTVSSMAFEIKRTPGVVDDVLSGDFNGDGKPDILLVDRDQKLVMTITDLSPDSLRPFSTTRLPIVPTMSVVGDFNNDLKPDVLVADRNNPGILPLIGDGKGRFAVGRTFAADMAVGAFCLASLNDDALEDIVLFDWVKSELHMLYGVGRGRFLDQSTFPVTGDISRIIPTTVTRESVLDLFLLSKQPAEGQLWRGNGLGDFQPTLKVPLDHVPADIALADINNDGTENIVSLSSRGTLTVFFVPEDEQSYDRLEFAAGTSPQTLMLSDFRNDGNVDAMVLDGGGQRFLYYAGSNQPCRLRDSLVFAVGVRPAAISLLDVNQDGAGDIALVNSKSSTFSVLFGRKEGGFQGQVSYSLTAEPEYVTVHSFKDSLARFVVSYPARKLLSFFSLNARGNSFVNAVIPAEGSAEVLSSLTYQNTGVEFATFNRLSGLEGSSLSFFEQLGSGDFLERNFRLSAPTVLLGAAVADLNRDSLPEIVYVYKASDTSNVELGVAFGDSTTSMKQRIVFQELKLPAARKAFVWTANLDTDDTLDLVLSFPQASKQLFVARGTAGNFFNDPRLITDSLNLEDRSQLQILDLDGDGKADIAFNSPDRGGVGWMKGVGDGTFGPARMILLDSGISHFSFGDLNGDKKLDLVVTMGSQGVVKMYDGNIFSTSAVVHEKP
ncbi:MAG: VCBS repeat-containing protein [Bacteroidota bacterium]